MALDDLKKTIETLQERIQAHRAYLEGYETRTRQALIDPMLRALGWDVEDPNSVQIEYGIKRKWADYALMGTEQPIAVVEAKALGKPLKDDEKMQVLNYANMDGIDYMAVTNGDHWQMFDVFERGQLDDRVLMDFQLTRDAPYACALQALGIWRPNLTSGKPQEAATPVTIKSSPDESVPATLEPSGEKEIAESSSNGDWEPLTSLKVEKGQKPPASIKFPSLSPKPIKSWIAILASVVEYLIETGKISAQDCPVSLGNSTNYLLHTEPIHSTGTEFYRPRKIGELWLHTFFTSKYAQKNACRLLEKFGVNPSTVLVGTSGQKAVELSNNGDWVPFTSLKVEKGQKPPANTNIKLPDSSTKPINHWIDILASVAEYLIETGKISAQDCPISLGNSSRHLLHTEPVHSTGRKFYSKREIGKLYLNTFDSSGAKGAQKNARRLLEKFGVKPSTVLVSTNRS